jgi:hypothetical protein
MAARLNEVGMTIDRPENSCRLDGQDHGRDEQRTGAAATPGKERIGYGRNQLSLTRNRDAQRTSVEEA